MSWKAKSSVIVDFIVGWIIALLFLFIVRNYGIPEYVPVQITPLENIGMILGFGTLAGILFGSIQVSFEAFYEKKLPIWKLLVVSIIVQSSIITLISIILYLIYVYAFDLKNVTFGQFVREPSFILFFFYAILANFVLTLLRQINLLLGPGNLKKFIKGEFYYPHEEARIFMFLDLRSSTTIAEKLGHIRYSQFIQNCFTDLAIVTKYKARIYQYVGDEAVLTWEQEEGLENHNCLRAFFTFEEKLCKKATYYQEKYGVVPVFKAGMNIGKVTVAEVGVVKREIAFHGDTINTAARIQEKCNELDKQLLISEFLLEKLDPIPEFTSTKIGTMILRGKQETIDLYAVEKP